MKIDTRWLPAIFIWLAIASPARAEPPDALCPTGPLGSTQDATLEREWESQFAALRNDLNNRERLTRTAAETFRSEALIHESDRDPADVVLRRTAALLKDLQRSSGGSPELSRLERELAELQSSGASIDVGLADARYALFANACRLRRLIALQNPLLDFDEILFIKRHRALYSHMCDQYYGMAATPGGGLYILADAFGPAPQPRDVLAEAVVERGRLAGQRLSGGPTTPPEWRFDGMGNLHGDDSAERQGRQPNQSDRSGADNPLPLVAEIVPQNTPISETTGLCLKTPLPSGERLGEGLNLRATRPSPNPSLIGRGTFATKPSARGSFLSPDLSYDGKTVLFAYVECNGDPRHRHHTDPTRGHWDEGRCFHIFKVNLDGTGLEQLSDGTWNDFDPCWLPNGRIAFISERRGGYLRCGRVCPTYTMFDMAADGSDITCLSFHETNEWHPSVTNDGKIIWTRWDYVDRHGCTAHMPWITTLDGRDPRAVHGNFAPRPSRPDMEVDCRAIPGSSRFVATAAPHHGQAYGSLVIIDPNMPDDDGMGPIKRITPEVGFPESQGGAQVYGTPWALSEDYYLCVYDAAMQSGEGSQGQPIQRGNYGIYLVDSFGNKELIYRDPEIACLSPIPVRARPVPPCSPDLVQRGPESNPATRSTPPGAASDAEATVAVINVYDSVLAWPPATRIQELRILQVFPMTVPSGSPPHETGLRLASAGDSVVPVRHVLGTVPVEEDGSAHFTVPANIEVFFQALDDRGMAVQSMRSATQLHAGESLVCAGCHQPGHQTVAASGSVPLALQRGPSPIKPDVDGSRPFSYPRLVQPVLDRHCVECHEQHSDQASNLGREPITRGWYASYNSLIQQYAFHDYGDGYRTTPGRFGARASRLCQLLQQGHYDVQLSDEELHRLVLWLDCSSMFYGVYESQGGEAQLRGEVAQPTLE